MYLSTTIIVRREDCLSPSAHISPDSREIIATLRIGGRGGDATVHVVDAAEARRAAAAFTALAEKFERLEEKQEAVAAIG